MMNFLPAGEDGLLIDVPDLQTAMALHAAIAEDRERPGSVLRFLGRVVPAAHTVLVQFDSALAPRSRIIEALRLLDVRPRGERAAREVTIDVIYNGEDLPAVARLLGVSEQEIVERHARHPWTAGFVGFAPGFTYLSGGDPLFDVPRRPTPRVVVPAGSVGLAGTFSGVYPRESSGGWQLLGVTTVPVWDERRNPPAAIRPGDVVRFRPVRERYALASLDDREECSGGKDTRGGGFLPEADRGDSRRSRETPRHTDGGPRVTGIRVDSPGMLAVFEDGGRSASDMGVTGSGAVDRPALRRANRLVGNERNLAALEVTGGNMRFTAQGEVVVCVAGANVPISIVATDGSRSRIEDERAVIVCDGESVELGSPRTGWRDYIAMQGGFDVRPVLGSASRDTMSGIGPDPVLPGDFLACGLHGFSVVGEPSPWPDLPRKGDTTELEVVVGPRDDWFTPGSMHLLFAQTWLVTARSNRVGVRLEGDCAMQRCVTRELASEGTVCGAIEIPSDGQPVLFLRDQPVTGGYPVAAVLTPRSLQLAGQLPAGARIRFTRHTPRRTSMDNNSQGAVRHA